MKKDGSCDTSIVEGVVKDINNVCNVRLYDDKIIAIKSTIPPGTTNRLNKENEFVSVIFNPEFLTEANFIDDFKNQNRIIIGGERPSTTKLRQVYSLAFPNAKIVKTGSITAEMVKYMINTFLATKVSFANEMFEICERLGIDYDKVTEYATYDERLGKSHWAVPGPDGHYGFGGSCFPKDINALINVAKDKLDLYPNTLIGAWETNCEVRPEKDWEELKGRAVVDE
jgi:UDPglucose 6-dehydrogenase